jgi:hypothetical protein
MRVSPAQLQQPVPSRHQLPIAQCHRHPEDGRQHEQAGQCPPALPRPQRLAAELL